MEFCLIIGHNARHTVCVQVVCDIVELPALGGELLNGPIEQRAVVGLKMYLAAYGQKICIAPQKPGCREPLRHGFSATGRRSL